jgi:hypothetical protein
MLWSAGVVMGVFLIGAGLTTERARVIQAVPAAAGIYARLGLDREQPADAPARINCNATDSSGNAMLDLGCASQQPGATAR